jgi:hypothetical protein
VIEKRILVSDRVRVVPREGFSWVDRRFLREHAPQLSHDAVFLYLFLAAVSDRHGLSYYKDSTVAGRIRATEGRVARAREELLAHDLVAFEAPLTQVLSLPVSRGSARRECDAVALARVLGRLSEESS